MTKICQSKSQPKHKEKLSDKRGVGSQGQKAEQNGMLLFSEYDIQFGRLLTKVLEKDSGDSCIIL